jgi:hypothetical protein
MLTKILGDETVYTPDMIGTPRPRIKISHNFAEELKNSAGRITNGDITIAHIPAGYLSEAIVNMILIAYSQKGSALTLEEVRPFYKKEKI